VYRGGIEVGKQLGLIRLGQSTGLDRVGHEVKPDVTLPFPDAEAGVPHPQPGVAPCSAVVGRAAPVLNEKVGQVSARAFEIVRVQRAQDRILGDSFVKARHQSLEPGAPADSFIEAAHARVGVTS
jgi:hypothetical protein